MPKTKPFDEYSSEYDRWYIENQNIYNSELNALKSFIPPGLDGVDIGVGTGRFAEPLCIKTGVEPSHYMAEIARSHGIKVLNGVAEKLPIGNTEFDFALMVTTICFFDDVAKAFKEAYRILKSDGFLAVAFIDKESDLGRLYEKRKQNNKFYKNATFYSVKKVTELLINAGFKNFEYAQTVYNQENVLHELESGYGRGSFVVIKASK
jgi:ubiquinone/menaquinone biosynthesis C-methylase UbiE